MAASPRWRRWLGGVFVLGLLAAALAFIGRMLEGSDWAEVGAHLRTLPPWAVAAALGLTALNFVLMSGYEAMAVAYVGQRLRYPKVLLAAFLGSSFSIALGHPYLTGSAVRYRLYHHWGFSLADVTRILAFTSLSFWIGYAALGGVVFVAYPLAVPSVWDLRYPLPWIGAALLALVVAYLALAARRSTAWTTGWRAALPTLPLGLGQIALSSLDTLIVALILHLLLPPGAPYLLVLGVYLLAVIAGAVSQVPGGLGVFDSVALALLGPLLPPTGVLGALIAYRLIYYLLPLLLGGATLLAVEAYYHRKERV